MLLRVVPRFKLVQPSGPFWTMHFEIRGNTRPRFEDPVSYGAIALSSLPKPLLHPGSEAEQVLASIQRLAHLPSWSIMRACQARIALH